MSLEHLYRGVAEAEEAARRLDPEAWQRMTQDERLTLMEKVEMEKWKRK